MSFETSRLRRGEIVAGAAALVLLVDLFVLSFYGFQGLAAHSAVIYGLSTTATGWAALTKLRWLILLTVLIAFLLVYEQGHRRAAALPVTLSTVVTVLGALTSLGLLYRVVIAVPGATGMVSVNPGGYLALLSAVALTVGGFMSLREEDRPDPARNANIPVVPLPNP